LLPKVYDVDMKLSDHLLIYLRTVVIINMIKRVARGALSLRIYGLFMRDVRTLSVVHGIGWIIHIVSLH